MRSRVGTEYERLREANTFMFVLSAERPMLQENGLVRFADFVGGSHGELVGSHGRREVVRMSLGCLGGSRTVFLKRFGPVHFKDALKDVLRLRAVRTKALAEFDMLCAFRRVGLAVPRALACGERHMLARDRESFLMVDSLAPGRPLDEVLAELTDPDRRRSLAASVGNFVRRMHEAGFVHTDLFAKHLFVIEGPHARWSVAVIDLQRARHCRKVSRRRRGCDLAALMISLPPDVVTPRERRTFLLAYLGKPKLDGKDLRFVRRRVLPRACKLSRRTVYRAWQPLLEHTSA